MFTVRITYTLYTHPDSKAKGRFQWRSTLTFVLFIHLLRLSRTERKYYCQWKWKFHRMKVEENIYHQNGGKQEADESR